MNDWDEILVRARKEFDNEFKRLEDSLKTQIGLSKGNDVSGIVWDRFIAHQENNVSYILGIMRSLFVLNAREDLFINEFITNLQPAAIKYQKIFGAWRRASGTRKERFYPKQSSHTPIGFK